MKKVVVLLMTILTIFTCFGLSGCAYVNFTSGYFKCQRSTQRNYVNIIELSNSGKKQKVIVIPSTIKGKQVHHLNDESIIFGDGGGGFISDILESVYIPYSVGLRNESFFYRCSKLKFLYSPNVDKFLNTIPPEGFIHAYIPSSQYFGDIPTGYYEEIQNKLAPANVLYQYNYLDAPNDGFYWVDNYEYGSAIEKMPPTPSRDGFAFDGWYREAACSTAWDFESDKLPVEKTNDAGETVFQETALFAKWSEK